MDDLVVMRAVLIRLETEQPFLPFGYGFNYPSPPAGHESEESAKGNSRSAQRGLVSFDALEGLEEMKTDRERSTWCLSCLRCFLFRLL